LNLDNDYSEALASPKAKEWASAMREEWEAI